MPGQEKRRRKKLGVTIQEVDIFNNLLIFFLNGPSRILKSKAENKILFILSKYFQKNNS